jgi:quinol monooxygenase YgiN
MELLVVTLAHTTPGRDADALARIRFISDTVRNAPGLVSSRFYRSRGKDSYYIMITTWDDEEIWQKAQERHNPRQLLLVSAKEVLTAAPQQWLMRYLWGYSRPAATPIVAAAHLCTARAEQAEFVQTKYIEGLRHYATQPMLAFAFLARGAYEEDVQANRNTTVSSPTGSVDASYQPGTTFLSLFSWGSEEEREDFYTDPYTRTLNRFMNNMGTTHILLLEPM